MKGVEWGAMLPNEAFALFFVALTREIRVYDSGLWFLDLMVADH